MSINIDQLKKKIIYRSNYRGTKEMDKLLGAFTRKYLDQLNVEDLNELIKLLGNLLGHLLKKNSTYLLMNFVNLY